MNRFPEEKIGISKRDIKELADWTYNALEYQEGVNEYRNTERKAQAEIIEKRADEAEKRIMELEEEVSQISKMATLTVILLGVITVALTYISYAR